ncbi:hypothetical protein F4818DRAFT_454673 [Hypoxylon cercidicola]|nr:hypothetical protein F4818DRAFT_454673 [Hypoxylon cercidicola]
MDPLESLYYHVALPPKLPQSSDRNVEGIERALLDRLIVASEQMRDVQQGVCQQAWDCIRRSLLCCKNFNIGGKLERSQLFSHLRNLRQSEFLILHVAAQNAGLVVCRPTDPELSGHVLFEAFEASPKGDAVLASQTLSWEFPGSAVIIPNSTFYNDSFLETLSAFLEQASVESPQRFSEYITKAGRAVAEERESPDPSLITSLLSAILEANGKRISPTRLKKRVKDDVCWHNSEKPWRRLPYWLVLRVGIARYLATMLGGAHGRVQYKFFVCLLHEILLDNARDAIEHEEQDFLKKKLCRRLFKLDRDHQGQSQVVQDAYELLTGALASRFNKTIEATAARIEIAWSDHRRKIIKPIPLLPRRAGPREQRLSLRCSRGYLNNIRTRFFNKSFQKPFQSLANFHPGLHIQAFGNGLLKLFEKEAEIHAWVINSSMNCFTQSTLIEYFHDTILDYINQVGHCYDGNAEQKSTMLLTIMEAWVVLDKAACAEFPLLHDFHPVFTPRLMECLHLPFPRDICRARDVESYLDNRIARSGGTRATLFNDPGKGCFAERYFNESSDSDALEDLLAEIQADAAVKRDMKKKEWKEMSAEYERLTRAYDSATCVYIRSVDGFSTYHDSWSCSKCQIERSMARMTINAFESPLPEASVMAKTVVFELECPMALARYRDATWSILARVASESQHPGISPVLCLQDYSELQRYAEIPGSISLASTTKSFLMTHYKKRKSLPVDLDQVCLPNGLRLGYFDSATKTWTGRQEIRPTFEHHCRLRLPKESPFSALLQSQSFNIYGNGPSSYEIAASHSSCPTSLNAHEYTAFQYLLSGKSRRWISILTELGSSNLNLSTETTVLLFDHLANQMGATEKHQRLLGVIHTAFVDASFCEALLQQLRMKIEAIASNWRETHVMEIIITLALRLVTSATLLSDMTRQVKAAFDLLYEARQITLRWVRMLRKEIYCASGHGNQSYLLWAALLCKRTYASYQMETTQDLDTDGLATFLECCATANDNIPNDITSLGQLMRNAYLRDLRMTYNLRDEVRLSIERYGKNAILVALQNLWPEAESKSIDTIEFETDNWLQIQLRDSFEGFQVARYNRIFGILLINGQPLSKLPADDKSTTILKELFGSQISLMKYPSSRPGMTYHLASKMDNHEIHIGYDSGTTIIRAIKDTNVLEYVPREIFCRGGFFDLPAPLIYKCTHWLNLKSGVLEIRQKPLVSHPHNWMLNITTSRCSRSNLKSYDVLVDPYCPLSFRVSNIFEHFEPKAHLIIYQPASSYSLVVDMPRMQLRWFVNQNQLLQSPHLQAEIDPYQCIDTWYGFDSKLVCRSIKDPLERSVLVPMGRLETEKRGCHVQVRVQMHNNPIAAYIRYMIHETLGRIDCASELVLIYKKAEIHALTSFLLPDPLTGLTGVETSVATLTSGLSQPWSPLTSGQLLILQSISNISPKRVYYPEGQKSMKRELWKQIPTRTQREEYHFLVDQIVSQSARLARFSLQEPYTLDMPSSGDTHLNYRALHRRILQERRVGYGLQLKTPRDTIYEARHHPHDTSRRYTNVLEAVTIIHNKPAFMSTVDDLADSLAQSLAIKGYAQSFEKTTIHDRLDVDVRREWGPLVNAVKEAQDQYKLMFFMGMISFRSDANMPLIRTLLAFSRNDSLRSLSLPNHAEYRSFRPNQRPQLDVLTKLMEPFQAPPPSDLPLMEFASSKALRKLRLAREAHVQRAEADREILARSLLSEWPAPSLSATHEIGKSSINVSAAIDQIRPEWERLYENHEFYLHLQEVQKILKEIHSDVQFQRPQFVPSDLVFTFQQPDYSLPLLGDNLMRMPIVKVSLNRHTEPKIEKMLRQVPLPNNTVSKESRELEDIIGTFAGSSSIIKQKYASDLKESLLSFNTRSLQATSASISSSRSERTVTQLQEVVGRCFAEIDSALKQPSNMYSQTQLIWLQQGQLFPAITPVTLLEQLRSTANLSFGSGMKDRLLDFAVSITHLQRQARMQSYLRSNENARFKEERMNFGHSNWRVEDYPDWLLLEVESNLLIRETQVDVALAIISPESRANSVLQLNMGQGKTSIIIPMVAVLLADSKNLMRISVPKPLLQQTAQLLHGRLGGLVGRDICHVPFSRRTPTKEEHIKLFYKIHLDIKRNRGVMLCLPEHQMSFMLSSLQRVLDQRIPEANMMMRVQNWMKSCARDVLDECDHTLAVKTQLIYPSGSQMAVDGHPHRWLMAEQILGLVDMHLHDLSASFPHSIEVVRRQHGGFPFVFFLRPDVEEEMIKRLRYDICRGTRGIIPIDTLEPADRVAIKEFLSGGKVKQSNLDRISHLCPDRPHVKQTIYLLRGLFIHRILLMVLKKRYNVQYGLHPSRDPVAVPFHAKGVPSEQSEFGHADVAILLTALAFYYRGIDKSQTRQALEAVLKSDDPTSVYDKWVEDEDFPDYLRDWHSINIDDSQQINQIWNCVRYKVPVIDYFMNNFVYPLHAKQFKIRLQSNGWDIPLPPTSQKGNPAKTSSSNRLGGLTTGFSGTNDVKPLLPLTIKQDDLPSLSHTNGEVLTYLLQRRSREYVVMAGPDHSRLDEISFLQMLKRYNIRILVDSGAQILEQSNRELAENWLRLDGRATVALYFDGDSPYILSKQGTKTPLLASPYADNLNDVLVYLDEAHTRGTDLRFGPFARAALTLGLGQTKDHTVQAAMRLRQLGTTQSVMFFAPPEVNQSIRDLCSKKDNEYVDSYDVIRWLINNTCDGIEQLQPLYYAQGIDFCNRMQAAKDFPEFLTDEDQRAAFLSAVKHKERQTLQQLYAPQAKSKTNVPLKYSHEVARFVKELETRRKTFQDTGQAVHASALQEVEQERETERETEFEVEAVRQLQKPLAYTPHKFPGLHKDLDTFARTGRIPAGSDNFIQVLRALSRTALGRRYKINYDVNSSPLFISTEFERTVKLIIESVNDNFMRPVQWILYTKSPETAIIVTPEEAELLINIIRDTEREQGASPTFLITYAAPVTRRMMHFNSLKFYSLPSLPKEWQPSKWLITELGYFAGRLYFDWSEYDSICTMLGIDASTPGVDELDSSETDAADPSAVGPSTETTSQDPNRLSKTTNSSKRKRNSLTPKPYTFTQEYLAVRRRGQDFTHTPMGFLCSGKPLNQDNPFFRSADRPRRAQVLVPIGTAQADEDDGETAEAGETMDLGNYDPSAELREGEDEVVIQYDESEMRQPEESGEDESRDEEEESEDVDESEDEDESEGRDESEDEEYHYAEDDDDIGWGDWND